MCKIFDNPHKRAWNKKGWETPVCFAYCMEYRVCTKKILKTVQRKKTNEPIKINFQNRYKYCTCVWFFFHRSIKLSVTRVS